MDDKKFQLDRDKLAPAGIEGYLVFVDVFREEKRSDDERLTDTRLREFDVLCSLAKSIRFNEEIKASISEKDGESFFVLPKDTENMKVSTGSEEYLFLKNEDNEIGRISLTCMAGSWREAVNRFFTGIAPFLDFLSYRANIPVTYEAAYCRDKQNHISIISYRTPYPNVRINSHAKDINLELLPVYSLYREAKNSLSSYYRFLCYYKIMEGIYRHLRPRLIKRAKQSKIQISMQKELVPAHPELYFYQNSFVGKSIKSLFDNEFTSEYRDVVAHFFLDKGVLLNPSHYNTSNKFIDIILVSELCARELIKNQEDYLLQYYQAGGIY